MIIQNFLNTVKDFFPVFVEIHRKGMENMDGIVFILNEIQKPGPYQSPVDEYHVSTLGAFSQEDHKFYKELAHKQIEQLYLHQYEDRPGHSHLSSLESRHIEDGILACAIKTENYYIAAAGVSPQIAQNFLIQIGIITGELPLDWASSIYIRTLKYQ